MSVRKEDPPWRTRQERLPYYSFIDRGYRPIEAWNERHLLVDVGCHASSLATLKAISTLLPFSIIYFYHDHESNVACFLFFQEDLVRIWVALGNL